VGGIHKEHMPLTLLRFCQAGLQFFFEKCCVLGRVGFGGNMPDFVPRLLRNWRTLGERRSPVFCSIRSAASLTV
jgi:hypothetical protein